MTGPVVLVTGASGGIGRPLVETLSAHGHRVVATDLRQPSLPPATLARALDVRAPGQWESVVDEAVERFGRIDVLINAAGYARAGSFAGLPRSEVTRHLDVNITGAATGMHTVLPHMIAQGGGHIVNVGSLAAVAAVPGIALYTASKFALRGLSLAVATEVREHGVAVSVVHPDVVDTPMIDHQRDLPEAAYSFSGSRILTPDEVVDAIAGPVLRDRPLEVFLPVHRGLLCKLVGTFPRIGTLVAPALRRRGLARQREEAMR